MKTIKIPKNVIINCMKLEGLSQLYIDTFFDNNNKNKNKFYQMKK